VNETPFAIQPWRAGGVAGSAGYRHRYRRSEFPKVFDPFFTTKPVGLEPGWGLSVVKKLWIFMAEALTSRMHRKGSGCDAGLRAEPE